jgi:uncharacterized protein
VAEEMTEAAGTAYGQDPDLIVWWGTSVECVSAVARLEREGELATEATTEALARLDEVAAAWHEVQPTERLRTTARRLLRVHDLRAADALQLAAAIAGSDGEPSSLPLVTLDDRMGKAAEREGFHIVALR